MNEYELAGIESIARGVCVKDGKLLLCRAKGGKSTYLPGGHIEFGESGRIALVRCPTVLVYAVGPVLAWFARRVIKGVRHVGLANVVAEKCGFEPPMPELLQEDFTPEAVAKQLEAWFSDSAVRSAAAKRLDDAMAYLQADGEPLAIAADEIMSCVKGK